MRNQKLLMYLALGGVAYYLWHKAKTPPPVMIPAPVPTPSPIGM